MPLVLPTGSQVRVMPQAPDMGSPRDWVSDPERTLSAARAGTEYAQQLLDLQNRQSNRELEAVKIKAAKAQNDLDLALTEHALTNLPAVKAHVDALLNVQAAGDQEARAQAAARAGAGALTGGAELTNATAGSVQASTNLSQARVAQGAMANKTPAEIAAIAANAQAAGAAYGGAGVPVPDGLFAPSLATATVAPVGAAASVGAVPPVAAPSTVFDDLNTGLLGKAKAAPAADLAPELSVPNANAVPGTPAALKYTAATGQAVPKSSGNAVIDMLVTRAKLPIELEQSAKMQDETRLALDHYVVPQDIREKLMDRPGHYDVNKSREYMDSIKNLQPKITYGSNPGFNDAFDKASAIKQTEAFTTNVLPKLLDDLGDPSAFQKTLDGLRDNDPTKGFFKKVLANYAASSTDPKTAARSAVIDYLDNRYQTIFNDARVGRQLKNAQSASSKDSNATLMRIVKATAPLLDFEYKRATSGFPPDAFKTVEDGSAYDIMTPAALVKERAATAPVTAVPMTRTTSATSSASSTTAQENQILFVDGQPNRVVKDAKGRLWYLPVK